jgi:predicted outer membrane repeat protein
MKHRLLSVIILLFVCIVALLSIRGGAALAHSLDQPGKPTVCSPASVVTNAADSGAGSLRDAIANLCAGGTITFNGNYHILLGSTLPISTSMTIDGAGHSVSLDGNNAITVLRVAPGMTFSLQNLSVMNGHDPNYAGGIFVDGMLSATNVYFSSNSGYLGGGIFVSASGQAMVTNSTFNNNSARLGGAIYATNSTVTVNSSTFNNNSAITGGGAIFHNSAGVVSVTNSTFVGNSAYVGGGIDNTAGSLRVTNSTFSGNIATGAGGGAFEIEGGSLTLYNNIVRHSSPVNCSSVASSSDPSNNLTDDNSCGTGFTISFNIFLGPLGSYGGSTQTFPLLPGSTAIKGTSAHCPATDQRGVARGTTCDIGAFESHGFTLAITGGDHQATSINTAFANPLALSVGSAYGEPVNGGVVTFAGPGTGASINPNANITATVSGGNIAQNVTSNGIAGSYQVTANANGAPGVNFSLTNNKYDTTTSVASSLNPSIYSQAVTFTATVTSSVGTPTGSVQFYADGSPFGSPVTLSGGTALTTTSALSAGSHPITGTYSGDTIHSGSTGIVLTQVVNKANTTTSVASSLNPSIYSQAVTFTATVVSGVGTPTGSVQFYVDSSPFGSPVTLSGGKAAITTSALSAASHPITTTYSGSPNYNGSTSATLTQVVNCFNPITVTSTANSGAGSLRQAVADVCPGGNITFGGDYTITLASELLINRSLSIDGGSHQVTASGNHATRVFSVTVGPVTFAHLTIADGNVQTSDCGAFEACGGGIVVRNSGVAVTVTNSTLAGNVAAAYGGGIFNFGTLTVLSSTLSGNAAAYGGGGLYNTSGATVQSSTFLSNSANIGGGVSNQQGMTIQNSTFTSNSANYNGGISHVNGVLTLKNSTISGNSASNTGGGLGTYGNLNLTQTIIANSPSGGDCYKGSGAIAINDHNLVESTGSNACGLTNGAGGSLIGIDPILSPLDNYGGSTATFALLPGSPAIDAGGATCPATDQRGKGRFGACDIGAFESQGFTLAKSGGDNQAVVVNTAFALPVSVTLSETGGRGLPGALITFTAPISGASIVAPTLVTTMTNTSGVAAIAIQANATPGTYTIAAQSNGVADVLFNLKNLIKMYLPLILKY